MWTHFPLPPTPLPTWACLAVLGRPLLPSDAPEGQDPQPVVVLGYKFWQRYYSGRTDILGLTLRMDRKVYTIVGVMPRRFTWQGGEVYLPMTIRESAGNQCTGPL